MSERGIKPWSYVRARIVGDPRLDRIEVDGVEPSHITRFELVADYATPEVTRMTIERLVLPPKPGAREPETHTIEGYLISEDDLRRYEELKRRYADEGGVP